MSQQQPTGRLVAILVGVILATGILLVAGLFVAGYIFASKVSVTRKMEEGGRETVRVETPLGRLRVERHEKVDPKLLNIPLYPGAIVVESSAGARVDLDLDFTEKSLRVLAAEMETSDPVEKVVEYYRDAAADFVLSRKNNGKVELHWEREGLRKIVSIDQRGGKTRIALANIGEPEAN